MIVSKHFVTSDSIKYSSFSHFLPCLVKANVAICVPRLVEEERNGLTEVNKL